MIRIIKFNESINPFRFVKNYGLSYILDNIHILSNYDIFKNLRIEYLYESGYKRNHPLSTFSQYKKYINNLFLGKLVLISFNNNNKNYLAKIKIHSVSINKSDNSITFKDKYSFKYTINDDLILNIDEYLKILKTLIGTNISFHTRFMKEKNYRNEIVRNIVLKNVYINKDDHICLLDEKNNIYFLDVFMDIRKGIVTNDIDPFGEENWDD